MKKLFLFLTLSLSHSLSASDICIDGIYYNFIGDEAEVTYKGSIHYEDRFFYGETVTIPSSVFYDGKTYPVTRIGEGAFWCCENLKHLIISNSVKAICVSACFGANLEEVNIPDGVDSIASFAFDGQFFKQITIGKGLRTFEISAFAGNQGLTKISVSPCNPYYTDGGDCNAIIDRRTKKLVLGCKNTTIPTYVESIGQEAFWWCQGLSSIAIPHKVTTIDDAAFLSCGGLEDVVLGRSVNYIGSMAFDECLNLTNVTCYASNPPEFADEDYGLGDEWVVMPENIYVPKGKKAKYESAIGWEKYDGIYSEIEVPADSKEDIMPPVECGGEMDIDYTPVYNKYENKLHKVIRNGSLYVEHNGRTYTITGAQIY